MWDLGHGVMNGTVMGLVKSLIYVAFPLAVASAVTALLWYVRSGGNGPHHPVFFYLLPIVLVALLCGSLPALLCAVAAIVCAIFFLYDPLYSFSVANPLETGELICFAALALIAVKCMSELLRPATEIPQMHARYASARKRAAASRN
jgi:K+-sensing histidine kinase KdpD